MQASVPSELRGNNSWMHSIYCDSGACVTHTTAWTYTALVLNIHVHWPFTNKNIGCSLPHLPTYATSQSTCLVIAWRALWWTEHWQACSDNTPAWYQTSSSPSSSPRRPSFQQCGRARPSWSPCWGRTLSTYLAGDLSTRSGLEEKRHILRNR